jgi:hypothetical protein
VAFVLKSSVADPVTAFQVNPVPGF